LTHTVDLTFRYLTVKNSIESTVILMVPVVTQRTGVQWCLRLDSGLLRRRSLWRALRGKDSISERSRSRPSSRIHDSRIWSKQGRRRLPPRTWRRWGRQLVYI